MDQFKKGLALFRDGKFKDAANTLSHASKKEPDNVKVWNALSVALSKTGNYSEALSAVDTALRLDPDNPVCKKNREKILEKLRNTFEIDECTYIRPEELTQTVRLKKPILVTGIPDNFTSIEEEGEFSIEEDLQVAEENLDDVREIKNQVNAHDSSFLDEHDGFSSIFHDEEGAGFDDEIQYQGAHCTEPIIQTGNADDVFQAETRNVDTGTIIQEKQDQQDGIKGWWIALSACAIICIIGLVFWNAGLLMANPGPNNQDNMMIPDVHDTPSDTLAKPVIENSTTLTREPTLTKDPEIEKEISLDQVYDDSNFNSVSATMMSRTLHELTMVESALNKRDYSRASEYIETVLDLVYDYMVTSSTYSLSPNATEKAQAINEITGSIEKSMDYAKKAIEASKLGEEEIETAHLISALQNIKIVMEEMKRSMTTGVS
ncbi:MAG: tetratricopeptide repeat protein [Methanomicrobiales archaeon]|nr:tetratricopeptide repeat protein [Methanomicrobiales archaeon]